MPCLPPSPTIISRCTITPAHKSTLEDLKLSVSDLPMLSCQYIQKGVLFTLPPLPFHTLIPLIKHSLSVTLTAFPPLAGRLITDSTGFVHLTSNDAGVEFIHANASHLSLPHLLENSITNDVAQEFKQFFAFDGTISYNGHFMPIAAVQVTELADGVFIGCTVNHAVTDGTSFWNFFNTFAEISRGSMKVTKAPDFSRKFVKDSPAVLKFPDGAPKVTFDVNAPLRERIFHFSRASILKLKAKANSRRDNGVINGDIDGVELIGKQSNDTWKNDEKQNGNGKMTSVLENWLKNVVSLSQNQESEVKDPTVQISSFQSLSAQLWRSVTRARKLPPSKMTTFRMAVNCRHRIEPRIHPLYFGNAIQSIPTVATVDDLLSRDLKYSADLLHHNVVAHDDATVRRSVENWEKDPRCFPLGNLDGASITMGSSPRFPMYDNDFGWGRPLAVRSGRANKFDGKISAFPGREGDGSVDLEVCLAPDTMFGLENDMEFMQYVSNAG